MLGVFLAAMLAGAPSPTDQADAPPCFDAAVVARVRSQVVPPRPDLGPGDIMLSWPRQLSLDVDERVAGAVDARRVDVMMTLHTDLAHWDADHLFFLRRRPDGGWVVVGMEYRIFDDPGLGFTWPVAGAVNPDDLGPEGFVPADYRRRLRMITFDPSRAWWLQPLRTSDRSERDIRVGLPVKSWVAGLADRRCAIPSAAG